MDPLTHLLASYTVARAARARVASPQMAAFLLAGIAPDADWLWHLPEPLSPLRAYGTATHSVVGASVFAAVIAGGVWAAARKRASAPAFWRLLAAALISAAVHLLLDLCATTGIEMMWPFRATRLSWNFLGSFDAILIAILAACALLPVLFGLVTEEIAGAKDQRPARGWPLAACVLVVLYLGARATLHGRAEELLRNADYFDKSPLHAVAFASGSSPFSWRGVVETDTFVAEVDVPLGSGVAFAPERAVPQFKPEQSPQLDAAAGSQLARAYTALARFPLLTLETTTDGARADIREIGDSALRDRRGAWHAVIDLDAQSRVIRQELRYDPARSR